MIENRSDKKLRILETSERRGEVSKIAAGRTEPEKALPRPDPEVPAKATRRRFSARYKLRVLEHSRWLRRVGRSGSITAPRRTLLVESADLATPTRARNAAGIDPSQAGTKGKAGQSSGSSTEAVEAENRKLKRKLEKFEAMLDLQKKVSQLLGISLASSEENGDES